jgi:sigma-E factor negative regulatory protein RseA
MRGCAVGNVMLDESEDGARSLLGLSALADGELDPAATRQACSRWHGDAAARASWHAYHLIGDVLRSDDLASDTARDAGFLNALRVRLAAEPVVLAPQCVEAGAGDMEAVSDRRAARGSRWSWLGPAAVAAGFMAVASVLVVTRGNAPLEGASDSLARSSAGGSAVLTAALPVPGAASESAANAPDEPQTLVADGKLVRDARLERYFAAHSQFGGSSALGVPSGFLRAATTQVPGR